MVSAEELRGLLESFVVKGGFQGEDDWKKIPQQHNKGPHLVRATCEDVVRILGRYLNGEYSAEDVDSWADGVLQYHMSGHIALEETKSDFLFDIIEELALSAEETLTPEVAKQLIMKLENV